MLKRAERSGLVVALIIRSFDRGSCSGPFRRTRRQVDYRAPSEHSAGFDMPFVESRESYRKKSPRPWEAPPLTRRPLWPAKGQPQASNDQHRPVSRCARRSADVAQRTSATSTNPPLPCAYGVSCRARAERVALRRNPAIRPLEPGGSLVPPLPGRSGALRLGWVVMSSSADYRLCRTEVVP